MATSDHQRKLGELQLVTVSSLDPGIEAGGTSGDFRCRLSVPLQFDPVDDWCCTVAFASFKTTAAGLYQIATSANAWTIAGTKVVKTIAVIPCSVASNDFSWVPTSTVVQWYPLAQPSLTELEIEIARVDTGAPIPNDTTVPSVVTLAFRRAGSR